jgi:hypothetical protein
MRLARMLKTLMFLDGMNVFVDRRECQESEFESDDSGGG